MPAMNSIFSGGGDDDGLSDSDRTPTNPPDNGKPPAKAPFIMSTGEFQRVEAIVGTVAGRLEKAIKESTSTAAQVSEVSKVIPTVKRLTLSVSGLTVAVVLSLIVGGVFFYLFVQEARLHWAQYDRQQIQEERRMEALEHRVDTLEAMSHPEY